MTEEIFKITSEGVEHEPVEIETVPEESEDSEEMLGIERISMLIADPDSSLPDIMRLIALEMALIMKKMTSERDPLDRGMLSMRDLNDQIKAYRELQRTLTESDALSKKDVLNMDGPKFKFVFKEIVRLFSEAMKDAHVPEDLAQNVMMQFGDKLKTNDESIRREMNKIEIGRDKQ